MTKIQLNKISKQFRFVYVLWIDSRGASPRWQYLDNNEPQALQCRTVGYLVHDGKDAKRIAPHLLEDEDGEVQINGDMIIPSVAILQMRILKE